MAKSTTKAHNVSQKTNKDLKSKTYFEERLALKQKEKDAVANWVIENVIQEGDSILLDAGTSLFPIAEKIAEKTKGSDVSETHFTIMTHNYHAFNILVTEVSETAKVNIVLAGGRYDKDLNALFGPQTIKSYSDFFPKVVLIGISGMVADIGLFCHGNTEELSVKELIFKKSEISRDRIIIADYTKLGMPDALCFGRSDHFRIESGRCLVVTSTPGEDADDKVRKRFDSECKKLENVYGVEVIPV